jgi:hypothetical protein
LRGVWGYARDLFLTPGLGYNTKFGIFLLQ